MREWRQTLVVASEQSLMEDGYKMGDGTHKCETCSLFAPIQGVRGVVNGTCSKHGVSVAPYAICNSYKMHTESPKVV